MLIVGLEYGQPVVIGNDTAIVLLREGYSKVRVGILAPADVKVLRSKLVKPDDPAYPICKQVAEYVRARPKPATDLSAG